MENILIQTKNFLYSYGVLSSRKGWFDAHTHNLYELIFFVRGDANHVVQDKKYKLSKNDLILIRPLKYHYIDICSNCDYERYDFLFDANDLGISYIKEFDNIDEIINLSTNKIALDILAKFNYYYSVLKEEDFIVVAKLLLRELFYNLAVFKNGEKKEYSTTPLLSSILNFVNEHLFTIKNINDVAKNFYITPSYIFQLFKKELKTSPKKYIIEKRLLYAQSLILTGERPTTTAIKCGFEDYTVFYRQYKKYFKISPSNTLNSK